MPLSAALQCAADVAQALRNLHRAGRWHGQVSAQSVLITGRGYGLRSPQNPSVAADQRRDAVALGALIFEILTGARLAPGMPPPVVQRVTAPRSDPAAIRAGALRIAARCLAGPSDGSQAIGKAAVELRLLAMLVKQTQRPSRTVVSDAATPRVLGVAETEVEPAEPAEIEAVEPVSIESAQPAAMSAAPTTIEAAEGAATEPSALAPAERAAIESARPAAIEPATQTSIELAEPPAVPAAKVQFERIETAVPANLLVRDSGQQQSAPDVGPAPDPSLSDYPTCSRCGSDDVHTSKACTGREKVAAVALGIPLYRCHRCYYRWFQLFHLAIPCRAQVHRPTY